MDTSGFSPLTVDTVDNSSPEQPDTTVSSPSSVKATKTSRKRKRELSEVCRKKSITRAVFTKFQQEALERRFRQQSFLSREERQDLGETLQLTDKQVMIWFQNRRGRLKKRGPQDKAYNPSKLQEINIRRPYPFLCGVLTSGLYTQRTTSQDLGSHVSTPSHDLRGPASTPSHDLRGLAPAPMFSVYPKEVQAHIQNIMPQLCEADQVTVTELTEVPGTAGSRRLSGSPSSSASSPPTQGKISPSFHPGCNVLPPNMNIFQAAKPADCRNSGFENACQFNQTSSVDNPETLCRNTMGTLNAVSPCQYDKESYSDAFNFYPQNATSPFSTQPQQTNNGSQGPSFSHGAEPQQNHQLFSQKVDLQQTCPTLTQSVGLQQGTPTSIISQHEVTDPCVPSSQCGYIRSYMDQCNPSYHNIAMYQQRIAESPWNNYTTLNHGMTSYPSGNQSIQSQIPTLSNNASTRLDSSIGAVPQHQFQHYSNSSVSTNNVPHNSQRPSAVNTFTHYQQPLSVSHPEGHSQKPAWFGYRNPCNWQSQCAQQGQIYPAYHNALVKHCSSNQNTISRNDVIVRS